MVDMDTVYKGASVIGGMIASDMVATEVGKMVPFEVPFKTQIMQVGVGAASLTLVGKRPGIIGTVGTYAAIGSFASAVLGLLGMSFKPFGIPLAGAGEEEYYVDEATGEIVAAAGPIEEVFVDEATGEIVASAGEMPVVEQPAYDIRDDEPII